MFVIHLTTGSFFCKEGSNVPLIANHDISTQGHDKALSQQS
jgi:hypothetical protein